MTVTVDAMTVAQASASSSQEVTWGKLTIEQYASLKAHVLHFPKENSPEVLERFAVDPTQWEIAVRGWQAVMSNEVVSETDTYITRFGVTFGATRTQLRAERPELKSLQPQHTEHVDKPATAAMPASPPEPPASLPAPDKSERIPERVSSAADTTSPWTNVSHDAPIMPAPIMAAPIMPAPVPTGIASLQSTSLAVELPRALVMPFVQGAAPPIDSPTKDSPTTAPLPKKLEPPPKELGGTSMAVAIPRGEALPFARGKGPTAPAKPPQMPLKTPPEPPPASAPIVAPIVSRSAVAPTDPPPPQRPTAPPQPAHALGGPALAPLPETPPIPLERHASLCVELAMAPNRTQETLTRYQMTAETKVAADNYWGAKMNHDPETRSAWEGAYNVYRDWLVKNKPSR